MPEPIFDADHKEDASGKRRLFCVWCEQTVAFLEHSEPPAKSLLYLENQNCMIDLNDLMGCDEACGLYPNHSQAISAHCCKAR